MTLDSEIVDATLLEGSIMAVTPAAQARELLESKKAEATSALEPFFVQVNEAVAEAIANEESEATLPIDSVPTNARKLAMDALRKEGYVCISSATALKIGW